MLSSGSWLPDLPSQGCDIVADCDPDAIGVGTGVWNHGQSGNGGTLSSGSWLPDLSPTVKQIGVVSRIRVHCCARSVSRSAAGPWRTSAKDDLPAVAAAFGADLGSVVAPEMSYEEAQALVRESGVILPGFDDTIQECGLSDLEASHFQFLGVFLRILQCYNCLSRRISAQLWFWRLGAGAWRLGAGLWRLNSRGPTH